MNIEKYMTSKNLKRGLLTVTMTGLYLLQTLSDPRIKNYILDESVKRKNGSYLVFNPKGKFVPSKIL